jgi:hypothetical protein
LISSLWLKDGSSLLLDILCGWHSLLDGFFSSGSGISSSTGIGSSLSWYWINLGLNV